ncbi:hypothetical protein GCM10010271_71480 [Streptomyces kurssanovii]|nr:hypothetical protein GCM10010271_71480 [Streptomyces kurssanovii]
MPRRPTLRAWLYRIDLALPKFAKTLAKKAALHKAMAATQTCSALLPEVLRVPPLKTLGPAFSELLVQQPCSA